MFRRLMFRLASALAVRAGCRPAAFWFGGRVLVVVPGVKLFTLAPDEARALAEKLQTAARVRTTTQR